MKLIAFDSEAFEHYSEWALTDKKLFVRLHRLITETSRDPFQALESQSLCVAIYRAIGLGGSTIAIAGLQGNE